MELRQRRRKFVVKATARRREWHQANVAGVADDRATVLAGFEGAILHHGQVFTEGYRGGFTIEAATRNLGAASDRVHRTPYTGHVIPLYSAILRRTPYCSGC